MYGVRDGVEPVVEDGALALGHRRGREVPKRLQRRHDPAQDDGAPELLVLLHTDSHIYDVRRGKVGSTSLHILSRIV